jgi:GrpB-like predicted nucleotidyltransferase (UPF0157 family)
VTAKRALTREVYGLQSEPEKPGGAMSLILPYAVLPAMYVEYDPAAPAVAARVKAIIEAASPSTLVEHIGSTAVPGCAGKGIVDLAAFYPDGGFEATRDGIDSIGFEPQKSGHAFPDHRPMRVGAIEHAGHVYRLHVHVVAAASAEATSLRKFRDVLCGDSPLRDAYQSRKRVILESGASDPAAYTHAKGEFIAAVIESWSR